MPTGITETIYEDISFEGFVWRALTGTSYGRIAEGEDLKTFSFEVDSHYIDNMKEQQAYLTELQGLTTEQVAQRADDTFQEHIKLWKETAEGQDKKKSQLDAMRKKVEAWELPTDKHEDFKNFMLSQIEETADHDLYESPKPKPVSPDEWLDTQMEVAASSLQYSITRYQEVFKSVRNNNAWLEALRASVPPPVIAEYLGTSTPQDSVTRRTKLLKND